MFSSTPVDIEINYNLGPIYYDNSKSSVEISKLYTTHNNGKIPENTVNGLTIQNGYLSATLDIENRTIRQGYKCYYPTKITINAGFTDSTVYISNKLRKGSCRYEQTERHEHTHLALGQAGFMAQIALLQKMLPSIIKKHGPIVSEKGQNMVEKQLFNDYNKDILELHQMITEITAAEQQKLDTTENYMRETALCAN